VARRRRARQRGRKYPQILAIWNRFNALVEKRGGKPGIEIDPVEVVGEAPKH
jgi:hypothetical protein